MNKIAKYLNQHIAGNVYANDAATERFSTDKSILKIKPQMVATPRNTDDVRKLVKFADQMADKGVKVSITPRGGGHDKTGAAIGGSIVMAMGEQMNQILEIDVRQRLVRVQPGVTIGVLNEALGLYGMRVPLEMKCREHTIGGMIANGLSGEMATRYGRIEGYVHQMEVVLASGEMIQVEKLSRREVNRKKGQEGLEGEIYRQLDTLIEDKATAISDLIDEEDWDSVGYEAIRVVKGKDGSFDLTPLFFSSQGTLGVVSEVILRAEYVEDKTEYVWAEFGSLEEARDAIDLALKLDPMVLDMYEAGVFAVAAEFGKEMKLFEEKGFKAGVTLVIGFSGGRSVRGKVKKLVKALKKMEGVRFVTTDDVEMDEMMAVRDVVSLYLNDTRGGVRVPVMDGVFVAESFLGEYVSQVRELEKKHGLEMPIFGSVLEGIYHVRPSFDLNQLKDRQRVFKVLAEYASLVHAVEGRMAGVGAEGRVRALVVRKVMNEQMIEVNDQVKAIFDPKGVLNPGVKAGVELKELVGNMRKDYLEGIVAE